MRTHLAAAWMIGVLLAAPASGQEAGLTAFADDFSTPALLAEKWQPSPPQAWKVEDGALTTPGRQGVRHATATIEVAGDIDVHVRLRPLSLDGAKWCGVRVRGVYFTLREDNFWYVYYVHGQERALGNTYSAERPQVDTWYSFRIKQTGKRYEWYVNGRRLFEFTEPNAIKGADTVLSLSTSGPAMVYDDVHVASVPAAGTASANLLRNSSFEIVPDHVPTYWIPRYIPHVPLEVLWRDWAVVDGGAFDGERSLRVVGNKRSGNGFFCAHAGVAVGKPCTFSVYLKSDRDGRRARLVFWEWLGKWHHKSVSVTTQWQRYAFTLAAPAKRLVRGGLEFREEGIIWADAAQLESGGEPTDYVPCRADTSADQREEATLPVRPPLSLTVARRPPVIDGKLDEPLWGEASAAWPLVLARDVAPTETTAAYVACDGDALYLAMRCRDTAAPAVTASVEDRDGNVFLDDSVEIFLDTDLDRMTYYQLVVNAKGVQFDAGPGRDRGWDGVWEAKTFVGDGFWSVEVALPLASFDISPTTSVEWGINLCRHCKRLGEYSSTAITLTANFHQVGVYPVLTWPGRDLLRPYQLVPDGLELVETGTGAYCLQGRLLNRSGTQQDVTVRASAGGARWAGGPFSVVDGGVSEFALAAAAMPADTAGEVTISGMIEASGAPARVLRRFQARAPVRPVLSGQLDRSAYVAEDTAQFSARIGVPAAEREGSRLQLLLGDGENVRAEFPVEADTGTLAFSVADLAPGLHPTRVRLLGSDGRQRAELSTSLRKLRPGRAAVAIDRVRRCLLANGRPVLGVMPLYSLHVHLPLDMIDEHLNHWADNAFRSVIVVCKIQGDQADNAWNRVFECALRRDLWVVAWPAGFNGVPLEEFRRFIERWKEHPNLLAWHPIDEPELYAKAEQVTEVIKLFRDADPYHPVYVNNTIMGIPSRFAGLPGDIVSLDDYLTNRVGRKVVEIVRDVEMMNEVAIPSGRPVWIYLTGNNLQNHAKEPTAGEQVAQTYAAVITGASGVKYFLGDPVCKAHWSAMKRTNIELQALAPVLLSSEPAPSARCSSTAVCFTTRRVGTEVYLIAVNIEDRRMEARFALALTGAADAVVLFEDRVVRMADGVVSDLFDSYERHVYRIHQQ